MVKSTEPYAALGTARVWGMLMLRCGYALGLQLVCAAGFWWSGSTQPWRHAADWWLVTFGIGHLLNLHLLQRSLEWEGRRFRDLFPPPDDGSRKRDLAWLLLAVLVSGPLAMLPNLALGQLLFGDPQIPAAMSFRPLPVTVAWALLFTFPLVHAITELPTYFGYVMPRLQTRHGWRTKAILVCALVLSLQHVFLPLLFDWRFALWRGLMFLPFALWLGFVLDRRPSLMPYLIVVHALLDASLPVMVLLASR